MIKVLRFISKWIMLIPFMLLLTIFDIVAYCIFIFLYIFYVLFNFGFNNPVLSLNKFVYKELKYDTGIIYLIKHWDDYPEN